MPIEYPGGGVVREHAAVRERVGIFDVSHLGKASSADRAPRRTSTPTLTNDLGRIGPGQAQYTLCCDDAIGGVVDDLIAYLRSADDVLLVPNAANTAEVVRRLAALGSGRRRRSRTSTRRTAWSRSRARAATRCSAPWGCRLRRTTCGSSMPSGRAGRSSSAGRATRASAATSCCRSGPTPATLWDALLAAAAPYDGLPCGLGARDTLRTEMGYPLHGHELSLDITPVEARTGLGGGLGQGRVLGPRAAAGRPRGSQVRGRPARPGGCSRRGAGSRARGARSGRPTGASWARRPPARSARP